MFPIEAALGYASIGWPVFPVAPGSKRPLHANPHPHGSAERSACKGECGLMGHGCHDATVDEATIVRWWTEHPRANVGLATGAPGPDVLDIDVKGDAPGLESLAEIERMPGVLDASMLLVDTPSGGLHYYFSGSGQGNGSIRGKGVDFRGAGGYVLAPPSKVGGYRYHINEFLPGDGGINWVRIRDQLCPPRPASIVARRATADGKGGIDHLIRFVRSQREGNRNGALHWAACRVVETTGLEGDLAILLHEAVLIGLSEGEARKTVESAKRAKERG